MNSSKITQNFTTLFPGDFSGNLIQRQTPDVMFCMVEPYEFEHSKLIDFNTDLSLEIGLGVIDDDLDHKFLVGNKLPDNVKTYSTAYAGHQFGNWAGQLGDGRAIYAGEIKQETKQTELQWKGAGATPYSRNADGRAVLRSSIREYLMSEAMHHLGVLTTRALSLSLSGERILRDIQYSGNPQYEQGAIVMRTAESFLRFGHFELVSARNQLDLLKELTDYTIDNFFPEVIADQSAKKYIAWFQAVCDRTLEMIINWLRVGFVHGVMNTDNMSVLGLTIDYGPFSMLDQYDLSFTPNTTDLPGKRYAFGKQVQISQWNLMALANAIFPLIDDEEEIETILDNYGRKFWFEYGTMMRNKFGFDSEKEHDKAFYNNWQDLMHDLEIDYTLFFQALEGDVSQLKVDHFSDCFYKVLTEDDKLRFATFLQFYKERKSLNTIPEEASAKIMAANNPKFLLRNYLLYECIQEAENGNYDLFFKLQDAAKTPYGLKYPELNKKRPSKYDNQTGCSMLSCSS